MIPIRAPAIPLFRRSKFLGSSSTVSVRLRHSPMPSPPMPSPPMPSPMSPSAPRPEVSAHKDPENVALRAIRRDHGIALILTAESLKQVIKLAIHPGNPGYSRYSPRTRPSGLSALPCYPVREDPPPLGGIGAANHQQIDTADNWVPRHARCQPTPSCDAASIHVSYLSKSCAENRSVSGM